MAPGAQARAVVVRVAVLGGRVAWVAVVRAVVRAVAVAHRDRDVAGRVAAVADRAVARAVADRVAAVVAVTAGRAVHAMDVAVDAADRVRSVKAPIWSRTWWPSTASPRS